jgi:transketolase
MMTELPGRDVKALMLMANTVRQSVIRMLVDAGSGHTAGPLGMADVFTALYFRILKHDPRRPAWQERDRVYLSNGHIVPVRYAAMSHAGYFPVSELATLRKINSRLQGHPSYHDMPALEASGGPLGQGLSIAAGAAMAARMDNRNHRIYCLMSDGELDEGQSWEAALFCGKYKLHNVTAIIDRNNIQIDGFTEDVMPLEPLADKWRSFGWHVLEVDGHNIRQIIDACEEAKAIFEKPTVIIAHTIPGKGVSFMESQPEWHGKPPTAEQATVALAELQHERKLIEKEASQ